MKETFYFPHDYNASQDPKIIQLISACGLEGLGAFWVIVELLHQQPDGKIPRDAYRNHIKMYFNLYENRVGGVATLDQICTSLLELGLFQDDGNCISSSRVENNKHHRDLLTSLKSQAGRHGGLISGVVRKRSNASSKNEGVLQSSLKQETKPNELKERKGKEIKGNKEEEPQEEFFPFLKDTAFVSIFESYLATRKKKATDLAKQLILKDLHKHSVGIAIQMLEQSIKNGWIGVFELKQQYNKKNEERYIKPL